VGVFLTGISVKLANYALHSRHFCLSIILPFRNERIRRSTMATYLAAAGRTAVAIRTSIVFRVSLAVAAAACV